MRCSRWRPSKNPQMTACTLRSRAERQVADERPLRTPTTFNRRHLKARPHRPDLRRSESKIQLRILSWRDSVPAASARDAWGIRRAFVFQQDSATAHRTRGTVKLMEQERPAFISQDQWPPNSPDLNPVDYKIWGVIQQRVCQSHIHSIDELKQRLLHVWHGIERCIFDSAIDEMARASSSLGVVQWRTFWAADVTELITLEPRTFQLVSNPTVSVFLMYFTLFCDKCGILRFTR